MPRCDRKASLKAVVLAGGSGTRLRPLTYSTPKQLLPVGDRPVLGHVLSDVLECGVDEVVVVTSPESDAPVTAFLEELGNDFSWTTVVQPKPDGLAAAYRAALPALGDSNSILYLGDCLITRGAAQLVADHDSARSDATILVSPVDDPSRYGIVEVDDEGRVTALVEKPQASRSNLAIVGVYAFSPAIGDAVVSVKPSARGEFEITDAIQVLVDGGYEVRAVNLEGWWIDTGTIPDLLAANDWYMKKLVSREGGTVVDSSIQGEVVILDGARVESSTIEGPAFIGRDAVIAGSHLGPNTHVGAGGLIERASVESSIVMDHSTVTSARLRRSVVGSGSTIEGSGNHDVMELVVASESEVSTSSSHDG